MTYHNTLVIKKLTDFIEINDWLSIDIKKKSSEVWIDSKSCVFFILSES